MAKEIERKYLIDIEKWEKGGIELKMKQAYLMIEGDKVVRVRISNEKALLTIKGNLSGITRDEFEYEIPVEDANQLMKMSIGNVVSKTRYLQKYAGKLWEIDVFEGDNFGLIVAEIELENETESFDIPIWAKEEVSTDSRYYNFNLSRNPFSNWQ
jgi:adenylate cyclase